MSNASKQAERGLGNGTLLLNACILLFSVHLFNINTNMVKMLS